jgi:hypothetical protein
LDQRHNHEALARVSLIAHQTETFDWIGQLQLRDHLPAIERTSFNGPIFKRQAMKKITYHDVRTALHHASITC